MGFIYDLKNVFRDSAGFMKQFCKTFLKQVKKYKDQIEGNTICQYIL